MGLFEKHDIHMKASGKPRGLFAASDRQRDQAIRDYRDEQEGRYIQPKALQISSSSLSNTARSYLPSVHEPATPSLNHVGGQLKAPMAVYDFEPLEAYKVPEPPQPGLQRPKIHLPD